ncbi:MAG: glycosyltransferase [Hyphomicrobiales bacterium]|nr:glycosyltransferase [Hyphomicrobiales bacterium]
MRILWLTREYPKPTLRGDLVYADNLIESLGRTEDTSLTVLALSQDSTNEPDLGDICTHSESGITWRIIPRRNINRMWSLFSALPGDAYRTGTPEYRSELAHQLKNNHWDAVVINHICMGWAIQPLTTYMRQTGQRIPLIYVSHNHEMSLKPQVAASQETILPYKEVLKYDARKFVQLERRMIEACDLLTTITDEDLSLYRRDFPARRMLCLLPGYDGTVVPERTISEAVPRQCIIFGSIVWIAKKQNLIDFARVADPVFRQADITVNVVGNVDHDVSEEISAWAKQFKFIGRVDDVSPHFATARLGIMPDLVGGGFKHKNLQYIFHRVPMISMTGQASGLPLTEGTDIMVAESYTRMAHMVVDAIDDFPRLNAMQSASFDKCAGYFDWARRGNQLRAALGDLMRAADKEGSQCAAESINCVPRPIG